MLTRTYRRRWALVAFRSQLRWIVFAVLWVAIVASGCKGCKKSDNPLFDEFVLEVCDNGEDDNEDGLVDCEDPRCQLEEVCAFTPPDPSTVATPYDPSTLTGFAESIEFLYKGDNPVIRDLDEGAIDPENVSALRMRVLDRDGEPLAGVRYRVASQDRLGYTFSRDDGVADLVANSARRVTVRAERPGFLPVDRSIELAPHVIQRVDDIVMTPVDEVVTQIDEAGGVATSTTQRDDSGERTLSLFVPDGTVATVQLADGQQVDLETFSVRLTEYTVGDPGPQAMPAILPDNTAYTYAAELSVVEADEVGAIATTFNQPLYTYNDNFLDFPTGESVPSGFYNRQTHRWEARENGVVLQRTAGGFDVSGSGDATSEELEELGISSAEVDAMKSLFDVGNSFWRVPIRHFSPYDYNWPITLPDGAVPPEDIPQPNPIDDAPCNESGSIIECQNQTMMKTIGVPGTQHVLTYRSDRQLGRNNMIDVALTPNGVPLNVEKVHVRLYIGGEKIEREYDAVEGLRFSYVWDRTDAYGRTVPHTMRYFLSVGYEYEPLYGGAPVGSATFGGGGSGQTLAPGIENTILWSLTEGWFGALDARHYLNMGGWAFGPQFVYDDTLRTLYPPDAPERRGELRRFGATAATTFEGAIVEVGDTLDLGGLLGVDSILVYAAHQHAFVGANDVLYYVTGANAVTPQNYGVILRQEESGILTHYAGAPPIEEDRSDPDCGVEANCGNGGDPKLARLVGKNWAIEPGAGSDTRPDVFYVVDGRCVRRVADTVEPFAGECGYESLEQDWDTRFPDASTIAVGPDGVYVADRARVVRVIPSTNDFEIVAGCAASLCARTYVQGAPAVGTQLTIDDITFTSDGVLHISSERNLIAVKDGSFTAPLLPAEPDRGLFHPSAGPDGSVDYYVQHDSLYGFSGQLRRYHDGEVYVIGGTNVPAPDNELPFEPIQDGHPADDVRLPMFGKTAAMRDGTVVLVGVQRLDDFGTIRPVVARIRSTSGPAADSRQRAIPSPDARHLYNFDDAGRITSVDRTVDGRSRVDFEYQAEGVTALVDAYGQRTEIERDASGKPTAIVGPFGHRTELTTNDAGYLTQVDLPDGTTLSATYDAGGLMTEWTSGAGDVSSYQYGPDGRLTEALDPEGDWKRLTTQDHVTTLETSTGRTQEFTRGRQNGAARQVLTDAAGRQTEHVRLPNGHSMLTPDGTLYETSHAPHPRFGKQSAYVSEQSVTTPSGLTRTALRNLNMTMDEDDPSKVATVTEETTINGPTTVRHFDAATRTVTTTSPMGRTTTTVVHENGRPTSIQVGDLTPQVTTYDDLGRVTEISHGEMGLTVGYEGAMPQWVEDVNGDRITFIRDAHDRPVQAQLPNGHTIALSYDDAGRAENLTSAAGSTFQHRYNGRSQLSAFEMPLGDADTFTWLDSSRIAQVRYASGDEMSVTYDDVGYVDEVVTSAQTLQYSYDADTGNTTRVAADDFEERFVWDGMLLTERTLSIDGHTFTIEHTFDDFFAPTSTTVAGATVSFGYDDDRLPVTAGAATMTFHPNHAALVGVEVGEIETTRTYDDLGRLTGTRSALAGTTIFEQLFDVDNTGRIVGVDEVVDGDARQWSYDFASTGELVAASVDGVATYEFQYDERGNRTRLADGSTATYDAADRVMTAGTRAFATNASGFVTSWDDGATTTLTYSEHDLIQVDQPSATITYRYDSLGRRISRAVDGAVDRYWLYDDASRPIAEFDGTGALRARFVFAESSIVPTYIVRNGTTYRVLTDMNGSVRLVVDATTGDVAQRIDYDPIGGITTDTNPGFQPFGFAGGLSDELTGIVRFGARDFDPTTGRFLSPDPTYFAGRQTNLFVYSLNDPINFVDPEGKSWGLVIVGGASAVGALYVAEALFVLYQWKVYEGVSNTVANYENRRLGYKRQDVENAMRHCSQQCVYTRAKNDTFAVIAEWYHELPVPILPYAGGFGNRKGGPTYGDRLADHANNECGRTNADKPGDCIELCAQDLRAGGLLVAIPNGPEVHEGYF